MRCEAGSSGAHCKSFGLFLPELGPHLGAALFLLEDNRRHRRPLFSVVALGREFEDQAGLDAHFGTCASASRSSPAACFAMIVGFAPKKHILGNDEQRGLSWPAALERSEYVTSPEPHPQAGRGAPTAWLRLRFSGSASPNGKIITQQMMT
jgi:hypothetical protein